MSFAAPEQLNIQYELHLLPDKQSKWYELLTELAIISTSPSWKQGLKVQTCLQMFPPLFTLPKKEREAKYQAESSKDFASRDK